MHAHAFRKRTGQAEVLVPTWKSKCDERHSGNTFSSRSAVREWVTSYTLVVARLASQDLRRQGVGPMSRVTRVGIIGTAGRGTDAGRMTGSLWAAMKKTVAHVMAEHYGLNAESTVLVSGGAAGADHVAVALFLEALCEPERRAFAGLHLYLPCEWVDGRAAPGSAGARANVLHSAFGTAIGRDSLRDVECARALGAEIFVRDGFHARNSGVASGSDCLIALTWGDGAAPAEGGTADTWKKYKGHRRQHVPLQQLVTCGEVCPLCGARV